MRPVPCSVCLISACLRANKRFTPKVLCNVSFYNDFLHILRYSLCRMLSLSCIRYLYDIGRSEMAVEFSP